MEAIIKTGTNGLVSVHLNNMELRDLTGTCEKIPHMVINQWLEIEERKLRNQIGDKAFNELRDNVQQMDSNAVMDFILNRFTERKSHIGKKSQRSDKIRSLIKYNEEHGLPTDSLNRVLGDKF